MKLEAEQLLRAGAMALCAGLLAVGSAAAQPPGPGGAQAQRPVMPLTVEQLNKRVYLARGPSTSNNSNNAFIVADHSVILFDTKNTQEDERALLVEIAKVTDKPITHVFISHSDGDHINGLPVLPKGVVIETHRNAQKTMVASAAAGGPRAANPDYLPTKVFDAQETLTVDGVRLQLYHFAPAHTGGDLVMYMPDDKIVFMGDIVITEIDDPFMHMENGGSPDGVITSLKGMIGLNAKIYVSGHGPVTDKVDLQRRLAIWEDKIAKTKAMIAQGKSLAEIKTAFGEPVPAPGARGGRPTLIDFVYQDSTRKN